jgi:hypothetical protein
MTNRHEHGDDEWKDEGTCHGNLLGERLGFLDSAGESVLPASMRAVGHFWAALIFSPASLAFSRTIWFGWSLASRFEFREGIGCFGAHFATVEGRQAADSIVAVLPTFELRLGIKPRRFAGIGHRWLRLLPASEGPTDDVRHHGYCQTGKYFWPAVGRRRKQYTTTLQRSPSWHSESLAPILDWPPSRNDTFTR